MANSLPSVPAHLRRFVVEQDYAQYNAVDQAVWRFVLLQMQARLTDSAHPTYRDGFAATGMSVARIPRIDEMNEKLSRFGWGAVCVDGFVPPRAFQEFQGCGILPIAAEIRTRQHLAYTPAPDIIHEAAGHAPILPHATYARYLRRIGELGAEAFTIPADDGVFAAIYALSEIKEDPSARGEDVARAEARLQEVLAASPETSDAARLSRLYWWTAEYGLVGRPDDYKIYGAGLLSSLGESHSCHDPVVGKLPLDERCIDVGYDITRPQPQLFVAPSFESLHDVLDRVARTLVRGGVAGMLSRAIRSREVASVRFGSGGWAMGVLAEVGPSPEAPAWLGFHAPVGFAWERDGEVTSIREATSIGDDAPCGGPSDRARQRHWVITGRLAGGRPLETLTDAEVGQRKKPGSDRHRFAFENGASVEGRLARCTRVRGNGLALVDLVDARLALPGQPVQVLEQHTLLAAGNVVTARAGAVESSFRGETTFSSVRVPRPRALPEVEQQVVRLYESAESAARAEDPARIASAFAGVHAQLGRAHPREWLLRWNLLETLGRTPDNDILKRRLRAELEQLEVAFGHRQPIASGLRYLFPPHSTGS